MPGRVVAMRGEGLGPAQPLVLTGPPMITPCGETRRCHCHRGVPSARKGWGTQSAPRFPHRVPPKCRTYPLALNAAGLPGLQEESKGLVGIGPCGAGGDTGVPTPSKPRLHPGLSGAVWDCGCQGSWGHHCRGKGEGWRAKPGGKALGMGHGRAFPTLSHFSLARPCPS